jgi:pimeloyl-ACP methyl ester carboxylesterase
MRERLHKPSVSRKGCLYFWGRGGNALTTNLIGYWNSPQFNVTDSEIPVASGDYGSTDHWGNDTSITRVGELWTYAQARGFTSDQVYLLTVSMGTLAALNWARQNPTKVAAVVAITPAIDLQDIHDVSRPDLATGINTAYGNEAGYLAALPTHSPAEYAAELNGDFPIRAYYSTDDSSVTPSTVTDFCTAAGGEAISLGAVGHSAGSLDGDDVASFFAANA